MQQPPEEFGDFGDFEENMDDFMEDEEALEAMRELETEHEHKSPLKKRMKFESAIPPLPVPVPERIHKTLDDITNFDVPISEYRYPYILSNIHT